MYTTDVASWQILMNDGVSFCAVQVAALIVIPMTFCCEGNRCTVLVSLASKQVFVLEWGKQSPMDKR